MNNTEFLNLQFWQQLIISLLTVILGIPTGIYLHNKIKLIEKKKEIKTFRSKLRSSLLINLNTLNMIGSKVADKSTERLPNEKLDVVVLNNIISKNFELFKSEETNQKIYFLRDNILQFNSYLSLLLNFHSEAQSKPAYVDKYQELKKIIINEHSKLYTDIDEFIKNTNPKTGE